MILNQEKFPLNSTFISSLIVCILSVSVLFSIYFLKSSFDNSSRGIFIENAKDEISKLEELWKIKFHALERLAKRTTRIFPALKNSRSKAFATWEKDIQDYIANFPMIKNVVLYDQKLKLIGVAGERNEEHVESAYQNALKDFFVKNKASSNVRSQLFKIGKNEGVALLIYFPIKSLGSLFLSVDLHRLLQSQLSKLFKGRLFKSKDEFLDWHLKQKKRDGFSYGRKLRFLDTNLYMYLTPGNVMTGLSEIISSDEKIFLSLFSLIFTTFLLVTYLFVINASLTRSKRNLSELQTKKEMITSSLRIGTWEWDVKTNDLYWDKDMYSLYEINEADFCGHYEAWKLLFPEDYKDKVDAELKAAIKTGKFDTIFPIHCSGKKTKHIRAKGFVKFDEKGEPAIMYGINYDDTELVRLRNKLHEQELLNIHAAKLASLGELSTMINHEIINPMAIITSSLSVARTKINKNEGLSKILNNIEKACTRVAHITKSITRFAAPNQNVEREQFNLKFIFDEIKLLIEMKLKNKNIKYFLSCPDDVMVNCSKIELEQVMANLIGNAVDAIENQNEPWIKITVENFDLVKIRVCDSGLGVESEALPHLFKSIYSSKDQGKGTGLGLKISKVLIDKNMGKIYYELYKGNTSFVVELPKVPS